MNAIAWFVLIWSILPIEAAGATQAGNIVFDIFHAQEKISPQPASAAARCQTTRDPTAAPIQFIVTGRAQTRGRWHIPVRAPVQGDCEIQFEVEATNLAVAESGANLCLVLTPSDPSSATSEQRAVPILAASGQHIHEVGRIPFLMDGDYVMDGILVDAVIPADGEGILEISKLQISCASNLLDDTTVETILSSPPPVVAGVNCVDGYYPMLRVNGVEISSMLYDREVGPSPGSVHTIRRVSVNFGADTHGSSTGPPLWLYPRYMDFPTLGKILTSTERSESEYLIVDLLLNSPPAWWHAGYLSDLDPNWRAYTTMVIRQLFAFVRSHPSANRVIGCNVIIGLGYNDLPYPGRDQCPGYIQAFRAWLQNRYGTEERLRTAWSDPAATFESALPLPKERWMSGTIGSFIHPAIPSPGRDSYAFYYESWAESICFFAQTVKDLSHGHYLTGIVGGPALFMQDLWNQDYHGGEEPLRILLRSPVIDWLELPVDTTDTRPGYGVSGLETVLCSEASAAGKMLLTRAEMSLPAARERTAAWIEVQRRNFIANLIQGTRLYCAPETAMPEAKWLADELSQWQEIFSKALRLPITNSAGLAFVVDPDALRFITPEPGKPLATALARETKPATSEAYRYLSPLACQDTFYWLHYPRSIWNRIGVPYDIRFLSTFTPGSYKAVYFHGTYYLDDSRLQTVRACQSDNRTLISTWANGLISDRYLSASGIEQITGIRVAIAAGRRHGLAITPNLAFSERYDPRATLQQLGWLFVQREPQRCYNISATPVVAIHDPDATVLGSYADGGSPALAVKNHQQWQSVYSGSPVINPGFLRAILRQAGVHLFLDSDDLCFVNDSFIGIHTLGAGMREIRLPVKGPLFEVLRRQYLLENQVHRVELREQTTYLFFRGDGKTWDGL